MDIPKILRSFKNGTPCTILADRNRCSKQYINIILHKHGLYRENGGNYVSSIMLRRIKERLSNKIRSSRIKRNYKCSTMEYDRIMGGEKIYVSPKCLAYAYTCHKRNSLLRGIEFKLSFPEWNEIWTKSGHLNDRGRGEGYVMSRSRDSGPYSIDNVKIITRSQNCIDAWKYKNWAHKFAGIRKKRCIKK